MIRYAVGIYLLAFLIYAFGDALPFLLGTQKYATVCEGFCGKMVTVTTITRGVGIFAGWIVLLLLLVSHRWAALAALSYFSLLVLLDLPALIVITSKFAPVWANSEIPYAWEILRIGIPATGAVLSYFLLKNKTRQAAAS